MSARDKCCLEAQLAIANVILRECKCDLKEHGYLKFFIEKKVIERIKDDLRIIEIETDNGSDCGCGE